MRPGTRLVLFALCAAGCTTITDTLGISTPAYPLDKGAMAIRDSAPVPAPIGRELAKELLPTHLVEPGDTLLVQPVELDAPVRLPPDQPVQPDGTIDLGKYGRPVVAGRTLAQVEGLVQLAIRAAEKGKDKEAEAVTITVRLIGRPGQVYYVFGEVNAPGSFPVTGRETVLDGIVAAGGLTRRASGDNIVLSRPTAPDGCRLVYPVCFTQIVQFGDTTTNYQLRPGDRVFVASRGVLEDLFPSQCRKPTGPCARPQVSCFGGGCAPGYGPPVSPAIPVAPPPGTP